MVPIVKIDSDGTFFVDYEYRINNDDYGFNDPLDSYFKDKKVEKLIYETR